MLKELKARIYGESLRKPARNEVTRQLRTAKTLLWKNLFAKTQNSRDFWKLVKKVKRQDKIRGRNHA